MFKKAYIVLAAVVLGYYALAELRGWELGTDSREKLPDDVRTLPGGYRSFHFWHSGYQGGK